jgi:hypothetical protein
MHLCGWLIGVTGQTGSGKTYTISAIQQLLAADLFRCIVSHNASLSRAAHPHESISCSISCFELAGSICTDLLADGATLHLRADEHGKVHVRGALELTARDANELLSYITRASSHRHTLATASNPNGSSRTHSVCRIYLRKGVHASTLPVGATVASSHSPPSSSGGGGGLVGVATTADRSGSNRLVGAPPASVRVESSNNKSGGGSVGTPRRKAIVAGATGRSSTTNVVNSPPMKSIPMGGIRRVASTSTPRRGSAIAIGTPKDSSSNGVIPSPAKRRSSLLVERKRSIDVSQQQQHQLLHHNDIDDNNDDYPIAEISRKMTSPKVETKRKASDRRSSGIGGSKNKAGSNNNGNGNNDDPDSNVWGELSLVDLAGSERNIDSTEHDAERVKQTAEINSRHGMLCYQLSSSCNCIHDV